MRLRVRVVLAALAVGALAPTASAQLALGADLAYFDWYEVSGVQENGALLGIDVRYLASGGPARFLGAYQSRLYFGASRYSGGYLFGSDSAVHSVVGYLGMTQEGQLRYRTNGPIDLFAALGGDLWRRQMSSRQREDFFVLSGALGAEYNPNGTGFTASARISYPMWTHLDAHLTRIGFDENPAITLGRELGGRVSLGTRDPHGRALIVYFDLRRFTQSNQREVSWGQGSQSFLVFQPATTTYQLGIAIQSAR